MSADVGATRAAVAAPLPFDTSSAGPVLTVDLDALARNYLALARLAAPADCAPVVKADAYGLGMSVVARRLAEAGARQFFVANLAEGQALRAALADAEIFVLDGAGPGLAAAFLADRLVPVLNSPAQVRRWTAEAAGRDAVLHIDTGMSRLGLSLADAARLGADGRLRDALRLRYVMTHLACADEPGHPLNREQLERFARARRMLPPAPASIGNTAGILSGREWHGDLVRPGIGLYGGAARPGGELAEVAALYARVLQLRELAAGDTVGYGATWRSDGARVVAVLALGYADGYPRSLGNRGFGVHRGRRLPVVGRVSMDSVVVDVTGPDGAPLLAEGDWVQMLGGEVPLETLAGLAGRISYEILTGIGARVRRVPVG